MTRPPPCACRPFGRPAPPRSHLSGRRLRSWQERHSARFLKSRRRAIERQQPLFKGGGAARAYGGDRVWRSSTCACTSPLLCLLPDTQAPRVRPPNKLPTPAPHFHCKQPFFRRLRSGILRCPGHRAVLRTPSRSRVAFRAGLSHWAWRTRYHLLVPSAQQVLRHLQVPGRLSGRPVPLGLADPDRLLEPIGPAGPATP